MERIVSSRKTINTIHFAIMVGGRWFMNMFWDVNIILKGEEVDDIYIEGGRGG